MENLTSLVILLFIIAVIWLFDRKNFKKEAPLFYLRRTKKGLNIISRLGKKHETFFKRFGDLGIVLSFGALGLFYLLKERKTFNPLGFFGKKHSERNNQFYTIFFFILSFILLYLAITPVLALATSLFGACGFISAYLAETAYSILFGVVEAGGLQLVLPFEVSRAPVFYVPISYWLVSIFVILVVHEFSHAFVSVAEGIKVKALGYGFLAILPLGFAEPDEKEIKKSKSIKKTRIYAAGSLSNILTALVALALLVVSTSAAAGVFEPAGISYESLTPDTPAIGVLPETGIITSVNEKEVTDMAGLAAALNGVMPDEKIKIIINGNEYTTTTFSNPENESQPFIGISKVTVESQIKENISETFGTRIPWLLMYLSRLLAWLFFLNLGIGLANLLPLKPLDGGLILEEIIDKLKISNGKTVFKTISFLMLGLILFNLFGPWFL